MFRCLLLKKHPLTDHKGDPFPADSKRDLCKGHPLRMGGALISKCGDWAWYKAVLGLRGWMGEGPLKVLAGCVLLASMKPTTAMCFLNNSMETCKNHNALVLGGCILQSAIC